MNQRLSVIISSDLLPILDSAFDGIAIVVPPNWRVVYLNPTLNRWLQQPVETCPDRVADELVVPQHRADLRKQLDETLRSAQSSAAGSFSLQLNVPESTNVSARCCRLVIGEQALVGIVLETLPQALRAGQIDDARLDPLTQLPDRNFLLTRLSTLIEGDRAADRKFAVLFVDLNNFKRINDEFGHLLGDRVLREVARRLSQCVREGDHVTRYGGDEFVILLERVEGNYEIAPVVARIHDALARPIVLPEGEFQLSLSIGVAQGSTQHRTAEDVLRDADRQMYAVKRTKI